jgi:energy-coupling factor transporter ATP-binding protein EcfA2
MAVSILKNQIISWLKDQDYWLKFAGNELLEGKDPDAQFLESTYEIFCSEYKLIPETPKPPIQFVQVQANQQIVAGDLKLQGIKEIDHVNALAPGQVVTIGTGLTLIYGPNGAGKTGYIRMLNNAFVARGDKEILQNVYDKAAAGKPACKFIFKVGEEPTYELAYPENKDSFEFSQYAVFDSYSAKIQLENDNKLHFTPNGFQFFDQLIELFDGLKQKLNNAIRGKRIPNNFLPLFTHDNAVKTAIINLGAESNVEELKKLGTYDEACTTRHGEITGKMAELKALNIPKKILELQALSKQVGEFIEGLRQVLDGLTPAQIEHYKSLIEAYHEFQKLVSEQGIKNLEKYNIDRVGSPEWKDFIKAAKKYATSLADGEHYPDQKDRCLFCLQPLAENEHELVHAYWKLLASQAEVELAQTIEKIKGALKKLRGLPPVSFTEGVSVYDYVLDKKPEVAAQWKENCTVMESARLAAIDNLSNCHFEKEFASFESSVEELTALRTSLDQAAQELMRKNPQREIEELEKELQFLNDKSVLNKTLQQVLDFISSYKWASKAEGCLGAFRTNSVTTKQGALFAEHISDRFTQSFSNECKLLNAPSAVNIVQRNVKMSTLRRLQVAGETANRILSEGEQRSISLADFLAETGLDPINKGIIFDDPVNSLDHLRKELIAKRLVDISAQKQVIVFTHDLTFLIRLKIEAENNPDVQLAFTSIRRSSQTAGIILPEIPWVAQNIKARIGTLKDKLVRIKKVEKEGTEDDYIAAAKSWYLLLREAWERSIEERLFKGVVERFGFGIQTQKLRKVEVTAELIDAIEEGMTESSKWVHDSAAGLNPATPDTEKLEKDLKSFEEFADKCKPA